MIMNMNAYKIVARHPWTKTIWIRYKNVPMVNLTEARRQLRAKGLKFRVRYRGTRTHVLDTRVHSARMQDCLKQFANRATIYVQGE